MTVHQKILLTITRGGLDEPLGTEVLNSMLYREHGQNDDSEQHELPEAQTQKNEDIHTNNAQSMEESQDIDDKDENNIDVQNSQVDSINSEDKNISLPRTAQNSVLQYPNPDLAKVSKTSLSMLYIESDQKNVYGEGEEERQRQAQGQ